MRAAQTERSGPASLLALHDAALLLLAFYVPIYWGQFSTHTFLLHLGDWSAGPSGLGLATLLVSVAALSALTWRWLARRGPAAIPNALHLPALLFVALTALATLTSVALHFSLLELTRVVTTMLCFALVANRALLPAAPVRWVVGLFAAFLPLTLIAQTAGESSWVLDLLVWLAAGCVLAFHLTEQETPDPVRRLMEALVLSSGLVVAVWGVRERIVVGMTTQDWHWKIFSTFFNANPLGGYLALLFPLAVALALTSRLLWQKLLLGFCALAMLAALLCTDSKGAILGLVVGALVAVLLRVRVSPQPRRALVGALLGLAMVAVVAAVPLVASPKLRTTVFTVFGTESAPNMFRLLTWRGTWRMALHHPVLGVGPGAFRSAFMNYAVAGYTEAAHENFLQVASEDGLLAGACFVWFLAAVLFTAWRVLADSARSHAHRLLAIATAAGAVAFLVHSLLDYDWYIGAVGLALAMTAGLAAHLAHGRPVLAPEPVDLSGRLEPTKGKRRRTETVAVRAVAVKPAVAPREAAVHRLPWPRTEAGRGAAVLGLAVVFVLLLWVAARSAMAQNAKDQGDLAMASFQAAAAQAAQDPQGSQVASYYLTQAVDGYRRAAQLDPPWAEAHELYGRVLAGNEPAQAEREVKAAIAAEPMNFRYWLALGSLYDNRRQFADALTAYQQALSRFPEYTKTLLYIARLYEEMGQHAASLRTYDRLVATELLPVHKYPALAKETDVDTNYAFAFYALGLNALQAYQRHPDAKQAETARYAFGRCLGIIADYRIGAANTDKLFAQVGRPRINRSTEIDPLEAKAWSRLSAIEGLVGRTKEAALARAQAERLLPQYPDAQKELAAEDAKGGA